MLDKEQDQTQERPRRRVPVFAFALAMLGTGIFGGALARETILGPDASDLLAAQTLAADNVWTALHSAGVKAPDHDIEVIRSKTTQEGQKGNYRTTFTLQLCKFKSQVGQNAPKPVPVRGGNCEDVLVKRTSRF